MPLLVRRRSAVLHSSSNTNDPPSSWNNTHNGLLTPHVPDLPRPKSDYGNHRTSRLSQHLTPDQFSEDDTDRHIEPARPKRFSLMKLRNFSESHLSIKAKENESPDFPPPVPAMPDTPSEVPAIVKTAPTMDLNQEIAVAGAGEGAGHEVERQQRNVRPSLFRRSMSKSRTKSKETAPRKPEDVKNPDTKPKSARWRRSRRNGLEDLHQLATAHLQPAPPSYEEEATSAHALPVPAPRWSESSQSGGSDGSDRVYGATTTTHTVSTHTTFFKLSRRNNNRHSLFPLPVKIPPPETRTRTSASGPATPRASTSAASAFAPDDRTPPLAGLQRRYTETSPSKRHQFVAPHAAVLAKSSLSFAEPGVNLQRENSARSRASSNSSPLHAPMRLGLRERASTASSGGARSSVSQDFETPPPLTGSTRNSTSTTGRSSLGGFLTLSRFRQSSEPHSPQHHSPGTKSKSNSFAISREALVIPEREDGDTPGKYLERLENAVARSMIAGVLSKSTDPFIQAVLRSYNRRFMFFGEPIDMSLRKFLLEAELPKETQQVDRVIQAFADRYHECNPGIFVSPDQAYIIAFSLMMLHTDAFNKNNKRKMQKHDYIKNTSGQQVSDDVLACFYDNICYTPFVHYEEDVDINGERVLPFKPKKSKLKGAMADGSGRKPSGPVDPYNLLVEQKLDMLRPPIKETITMDDPYNYLGSHGDLDPAYLQSAFTHTGVLQIISARSRPAAYEGQLGAENGPNPEETQAGIVDLKITKVGTLWRKAAKKKKARSPWQEWGAVLTGSQLYLFKNAHWAKGLVHQFQSQQRKGHTRTPVIFKPPLQEFKPDALIKTDNAVALTDSTYTRHKHAFTFFRAGGQEEVFLADNEDELNDWLALINYAAAFRAAGVRIRGMVGGNEEDLRAREATRLTSLRDNAGSPTRPTEEKAVARGGLSPQLQRQVMAARRQIMISKISEFEKDVAESVKQLDGMLRNARHLLVLAPIAPKTREDIMHAAARVDAMVKWVRRDIWRMKCHRDILAQDAQLDGLSASELAVLAEQHAVADTSQRENNEAIVRTVTRSTRTPPHSPIVERPARLSKPDSTGSYIGEDVFRTPPESKAQQTDADGYQLPPLQLDVQPREHRGSIASTLLSVSSPGGPALSLTSSTGSARNVDRQTSQGTHETESNAEQVTPVVSKDQRPELLARATMAPEAVSPAAKGLNVDGTPVITTPESGKHRASVRRSLQKTLRDSHHPGPLHKHRRGKESEGTIRSGGGDTEELVDGTPRLQRETGRFILHGKQASVVQFGGDWSNDHMKQRQEQFRQTSLESGSKADESETERLPNFTMGSRSPLVQTFDHATDDDAASTDSAHSHSLRLDAEAAAAYTKLTASPEPSSEAEEGAASEPNEAETDRDEKRQTIIGPGLPLIHIPTSDASSLVSAPDDDSVDPRDRRRTILGQHIHINEGAHHASAAGSVHTGGEGSTTTDVYEEDVGDKDEGVAAIDDDELRRISHAPVSVT